MMPARAPLPARPTILIDDARREGPCAEPASFDADTGDPAAGAAGEPLEGCGAGGAGAGGAVAVKVADVASGAVTTLYEPTCVGVYEPVPDPPASTVIMKVLIDESGAVTCTVCVEWAVNPLRVMVLGVPTVADDAVILGDPGGDDVDAAPQRSDADPPMAFTATTEKVCHAEGLSPVAVYDVPVGTSTAAPPSTLTVYLRMADPPVLAGACQLAVIAVSVTLPNVRFVGASGMVASVARLPVSAVEDPAPFTTVMENECDVPGDSPLAVKLVVGDHVSVPPSTRTW